MGVTVDGETIKPEDLICGLSCRFSDEGTFGVVADDRRSLQGQPDFMKVNGAAFGSLWSLEFRKNMKDGMSGYWVSSRVLVFRAFLVAEPPLQGQRRAGKTRIRLASGCRCRWLLEFSLTRLWI